MRSHRGDLRRLRSRQSLLGAWWRAAERRAVQGRVGLLPLPAADRVSWRGDPRHKLHQYPPIRVGDVDHRAGRVLLRDTKNRSDHKLLLSRQALADREAQLRWPKADEPLFPIVDARKTLRWINEEAGTKVQGHGLRATFASIAEELVSSALLKRMMNHAAAGDVTLGHYVAKSEAQLRAGWQAVADFVEEAARRGVTRIPSSTRRRHPPVPPRPAAQRQPPSVSGRKIFDAECCSATQASLNGSSRNGLPVSRAMALANAGASGGRPGSPMPVGGSALGTMCTAICGMSVMRGTTKSPKLLCCTTPSFSVMAAPGRHIDRPITAAPCTCASTLRGLTARLQCTPAVTRCSTGVPSCTEASTT